MHRNVSTDFCTHNCHLIRNAWNKIEALEKSIYIFSYNSTNCHRLLYIAQFTNISVAADITLFQGHQAGR